MIVARPLRPWPDGAHVRVDGGPYDGMTLDIPRGDRAVMLPTRAGRLVRYVRVAADRITEATLRPPRGASR